MTPKEKAEELVEKMRIKQPYPNKKTFAKQCALIAVDEIIIELTQEISPSIHGFRHKYWQQVRTEIENI